MFVLVFNLAFHAAVLPREILFNIITVWNAEAGKDVVGKEVQSVPDGASRCCSRGVAQCAKSADRLTFRAET